jgi:hypothetical protein
MDDRSDQDRADQRRRWDPDPGLLLELPDRGVQIGLARVDAAAGRDPPAAPGDPRVGVGEQQEPVTVVDEQDPRGAALPPGSLGRRDRDEGAAAGYPSTVDRTSAYFTFAVASARAVTNVSSE